MKQAATELTVGGRILFLGKGPKPIFVECSMIGIEDT
jgi:hypothetical protein